MIRKKKKPEKQINKEFVKYMLENPTDCAEDVFKKANTPWQRQVAVELFINEKDHALMKKDTTHIKKMIWATFAVVVIGLVANFASTYILPLLGGV